LGKEGAGSRSARSSPVDFKPNVQIMAKIAKVLGVSIEDLIK